MKTLQFNYFILSCLIFMLLDATWITSNMNYYLSLAYKIQKEPNIFKPFAIVIVYIFLFITLYFCIHYIELLDINKKDYLMIAFISSLYGMGVYGVFSYTTCIFLNNYNYTNAFIDTIWAIVLYSIPTITYFYLTNK